MKKPSLYNSFRFAETPFNEMMKTRISKVLLVSSEYDYFGLEEDGRIEEQLFNEYNSLNLEYPPRIIHAKDAATAMRVLNGTYIDLVISMLNVGGQSDVFQFAQAIKNKFPEKPVVVLTPFSREVSLRLSKEDLSGIDYVFSWLGHADILLAIIKLIEDQNNAEHDILTGGVQAILLVEDSVRYYSSYLPNIYKMILSQSKKFMKEGLNANAQMLRMRGRPKLLLARNYEQAVEMYDKYQNNLLGVISDTKYPRNGNLDDKAGIKFIEKLKENDRFLPILLQSSDLSNKIAADDLNVGFMHKYSKTLSTELSEFINEYFAFGVFKFKDPKTKKTIGEAEDLQSLQKWIFEIPDNSFEYHITRNHFSKWLNARAVFPIAELVRQVSKDDFQNLMEVRVFLSNAISNYRKSIARGMIAKFNRNSYDELFIFSRIGNGYIGGKARGLAFLDNLIKKNPELEMFDNVNVRIPRTVVLSTEVFDKFIEINNLQHFALSDLDNSKILDRFIASRLPDDIVPDLEKFLEAAKNPIAIRSSSVLEDSHYQPFAGVYSTFMISNAAPDFATNLEQLQQAVKCVYASVFFKGTKAYMLATSNLIDEEKMGIVLQEVCGNRYGNRFYPSFSGVARSVNFYPIELEKSEDGIANVALGLGRHIVEGKKTIRFSPKYPQKILQLSSPNAALSETQRHFSSLDLDWTKFKPSVDEGINIIEQPIDEAEKDGSLYDISSVYDYRDNTVKEGRMYEGKRLITFANVLKHKSFPLAEILQKVLKLCSEAMNNPVELEFAVNLHPENGGLPVFNLLQIRPIVEDNEELDVNVENIEKDATIISSSMVLGNGFIKEIYDLIYVKTESFGSENNIKIVPVIERLNNQLTAENRNFVLIGPGRWGSSDSWLGIPVKWSQISGARLIVESGLNNYRIDPSQGTHFFQNLTSFKVGYFTINPYRNDGFYDLDFLNQQEAIYEDEFLRHIRFEKQICIKIDGKHNKGVLMKPDIECQKNEDL